MWFPSRNGTCIVNVFGHLLLPDTLCTYYYYYYCYYHKSYRPRQHIILSVVCLFAAIQIFICNPCGIRFSSLSTLDAHQTYYCSRRHKKGNILYYVKEKKHNESRLQKCFECTCCRPALLCNPKVYLYLANFSRLHCNEKVSSVFKQQYEKIFSGGHLIFVELINVLPVIIYNPIVHKKNRGGGGGNFPQFPFSYGTVCDLGVIGIQK